MNGGTDHKQFSAPPEIQMVQVDSSQIYAWGYSPEKQKLRVQFLNKGAPAGIYEYQNVTPEHWATLTGAESAGSMFHKLIKNNVAEFPYTRMG